METIVATPVVLVINRGAGLQNERALGPTAIYLDAHKFTAIDPKT